MLGFLLFGVVVMVVGVVLLVVGLFWKCVDDVVMVIF